MTDVHPRGIHHGIFNVDIDYVGAFLFETAEETPAEHTRARPPMVAPATMVPQENPEDYPESPPPVSGYRAADVQGVACWNCGHFTVCGDNDDDGVVDGICNLWETQADGEYTCDRFTAHPDLFRQQPHTSWSEDAQDQNRGGYDRQFDRGPSVMEADYSDQSAMNEIRFSDSTPGTESDGLVWKNILRTGVWNTMPTTKGVIKKRLKIIKDGATDIVNGVISLSELKRNFDDQAVPYVTIPLSDDLNDHKNIARLNTGLVRQLKLVDENGTTFLRAGMDFTEPDVKGKVLRGTYPDVSAGIPFSVTRRSDDKFFSSVLDHVCITRKPFLDGLGPFGIAAADSDIELPSEAYEMEGEPSRSSSGESPPPNSDNRSFRETENLIRKSLRVGMVDPASYDIEDVATAHFIIRHRDSKCAWKARYKIQGDIAEIDPVNSWEMIDEGKTEESEKPAEPVTASDRLRQAHQLRELRLSQPNSDSGGIQMSVLDLDGVELTDEARARIQAVIEENSTLRSQNRESAVNERIAELSEIPGLKDRPGALKLYRQVMLADDGQPGVVFSDDQGKPTGSATVKEVLDQFIDALRAEGTEERGIHLSDQALSSGSDIKPPLNADGERRPLDERVAEGKEALYGKQGQRRTGRK